MVGQHQTYRTMHANKYQADASRTLIDAPDFELAPEEIMILWNALGLAGEAGEVADEIKKAVLHRHGISEEVRMKLKKELGDVLWYVAALCTNLRFNMEDVMTANIQKLKERYPDGYSAERSVSR